MKFDLSFWRFVIIFSISRSFLWAKDEDTYYFHIGAFSKEEKTALKIIILPFSLMIGFVTPITETN